MDIASFSIPDSILRSCPDWHQRVEKCSNLLKAVNYALSTSIDITYVQQNSVKRTSKAVRGNARVDRQVEVLFGENAGISAFNSVLAHEIDHVSQIDRNLDLFGWHYLNTDALKTLASKENHLRRIYRLMPTAEFTTLKILMEFCAEKYMGLVLDESDAEFRTTGPKKVRKNPDQSDTEEDGIDDFISKGVPVWAKKSVQEFNGTLEYVLQAIEIGGCRPAVQWIANSSVQVLNCISGLQDEPEEVNTENLQTVRLLGNYVGANTAIRACQDRARSLLPEASAKIFSLPYAFC